jgi:hypothetical protein
MGCNWKKIQYNEEGSYGSTEIHTLYIKSSRSCDWTTYYDDQFNPIFSCGDRDNNMLDAIVKSHTTMWDNLEDLTSDEFQKVIKL